ncbi:MAG: hypothetical protein D3920_06725 [Candidatus Electrothrix sp. AW2]|nr:hypothetical protein [Candidatus Electrothrix gigas]
MKQNLLNFQSVTVADQYHVFTNAQNAEITIVQDIVTVEHRTHVLTDAAHADNTTVQGTAHADIRYHVPPYVAHAEVITVSATVHAETRYRALRLHTSHVEHIHAHVSLQQYQNKRLYLV